LLRPLHGDEQRRVAREQFAPAVFFFSSNCRVQFDVQHLSNFPNSYPSVFLNDSVSTLDVVFGYSTLTGALIELRQTRLFFRI
jgi:hypothetical protein